MRDDPTWLTAVALIDGYRNARFTPTEVCEVLLARLDRIEPKVGAFQYLTANLARDAARAATERWRRGESLGPLDGVPVSIKDLYLVAGAPTRSGSRTSTDAPALEDAPGPARLREAGAVIVGKTTTPEFGWKGMTDSPLRGFTRNPFDLTRTPGGSSGGAAAAVASGMQPLAFGSDGGGSIRIPASFCGLVGFKPTFGRVPSWPAGGVFATNSSCGPMARSVIDAATMLNVIARPDSRDWHALPPDSTDYVSASEGGVSGMRIAFSLELGDVRPTDEIARAVQAAVRTFERQGARVADVGALIAPLKPRFLDLWLLGFATRLRTLPKTQHDLLDPGFREHAEAGLSLGFAEFARTHAARVALGEQLSRFHDDYDVLITPTMAVLPPPVEVRYDTPAFDRWLHGAPYTLPFNLTGQPAISVPCAFSANGLPIGLQIVGRKYDDARVLRAARAFERTFAIDWPRVRLDPALG